MNAENNPSQAPEAPPPSMPPPPPFPDRDDSAQYDGAGQGGNFGIGPVLRKTLKTLLEKPVLFFGLTILAAVPGVLIELLTDESVTANLVNTLINVFFGVVIQGAIAYGVYRCLKGETVSFGDAISRGSARFLPILFVAVIYGLGIGIGIMLLVVPGLLLACIWTVCVPACVVEKLGAIDSLRRSAALTAGYRWRIFALLILLFAVSSVLGVAVILVTAASGSPTLVVLAAAIITIIPSTFQNVMMSVIYYELRAVKEGVGVNSLANVFD